MFKCQTKCWNRSCWCIWWRIYSCRLLSLSEIWIYHTTNCSSCRQTVTRGQEGRRTGGGFAVSLRWRNTFLLLSWWKVIPSVTRTLFAMVVVVCIPSCVLVGYDTMGVSTATQRKHTGFITLTAPSCPGRAKTCSWGWSLAQCRSPNQIPEQELWHNEVDHFLCVEF